MGSEDRSLANTDTALKLVIIVFKIKFLEALGTLRGFLLLHSKKKMLLNPVSLTMLGQPFPLLLYFFYTESERVCLYKYLELH